CTGSYLYDERRSDQAPEDKAFALQGGFCTLGTNEVVRPIKILVAMDASQSMKTNDPGGSRAYAIIDLIESLPNDPEIFIAVMLFAGSTSVYFTGPDDNPFLQVCTPPATGSGPCVPVPQAVKDTLISKLLNFTK